MMLALLLLSPVQIVSSVADLESAIRGAKPGSVIAIAPGEYRGGGFFRGIRGSANARIVIRGADPQKPPVFVGGLQFSSIEHVEISDLVIKNATSNGINIDDAGAITNPSRHVVLKNLRISDLPKGNHDGIKLSGLDDFRVENCTVERWGGSGIDMVGCHRGVITGCTFRDGGDNAVQTKGGTSQIEVLRNRFENAGQRGVNIGGSTGLDFFRPALSAMPANAKYEAKEIGVHGNTFVGSMAPIAFVGVDGASVTYNTILNPGRWAIRILQETQQAGFVPSRNGVFASNLVVFRSDSWASGGMNVGGGTAPDTFAFKGNWWYCSDQPARSRPSLPTAEKEGTVGTNPMLKADLTVEPGSPAKKVGAHAYPSK